MTRIFSSIVAIGLALAAATPAAAAQVSAATSVHIVKPVSLTKLQDLDLGTLSFSGFAGTRTVVISRAGVVTCAADIVCSGVTKAARFNVQGTNRLVVLLTISGGSLSNGVDSIPFTPNGPSSITLTNTGAPGNDFEVGGSIGVEPTLVGGTYSGTINVTAEYQ